MSLAAKTSTSEGFDLGWLVSAITSASDQAFAPVDSGATNAWRQARDGRDGEISAAGVIQVDLASGAAELHINQWGTLLSAGPCQVIIPAGHLVQLGFTISWRRKGCIIQRGKEASLEVKVVKGCPLISREVGLRLLDEYEVMRESGGLITLKREVVEDFSGPSRQGASVWLSRKVAGGTLSREDQLVWLHAVFPEVLDS